MYTLQPAAQKVSCVCLNVVYSSVQGTPVPRLRHFMEATELLDGVYEQELRMISDVVGTGHWPRSVELVRSPLERIVEASKNLTECRWRQKRGGGERPNQESEEEKWILLWLKGRHWKSEMNGPNTPWRHGRLLQISIGVNNLLSVTDMVKFSEIMSLLGLRSFLFFERENVVHWLGCSKLGVLATWCPSINCPGWNSSVPKSIWWP